MRNLYARLILWLIRPALDRRTAIDARISVSVNDDLAAGVRRVVEKELRAGGALWRHGAR
ncbi:hypothetical protein [Achromobacter xylosoxidans]|uniref:hypothetical protein n=1 Tax=Alcaligenes xylosoxydans xylosoxydans TaxID=85698 RepID=UPI00244806BE|nr:hypothetical protein [Achromobacter xylosoxidans]MDH0519965.1 hypothetical protein [Achromobacter xylosoxidans]MDH0543861.1 hypothetical protein [Achromobacter xylosoxidans]